MEIIKHIEKYLGTITEGESVTLEDYGKLTLLKFIRQPFENVTTYVTLGLSNHILNIKENKNVRMEVLASVYTKQENNFINDLLIYISNKMLINHKAILRGQVISIPKKVLGNNLFDSVYVSIPVFFEEEFASIKGTDPDIVFAWIFPIYKSEADSIHKDGWCKFEEFLEENEIGNLWDLNRDKFQW
ncbi:suppressor of fused domain protein [Sphingobacterium sp. DR205]|uniref:suppressor of fused domain protein n=1 Tax=Sphingobacterium sp. DR205 TaxID=2713573 RepID=UPI0013E41B90|nr:suppressor of fused domain protein [Sphingobacterium sp. DR205]QIH34486.1 suppressor of fused domain protein [Sphingobacterium sp. DR205]